MLHISLTGCRTVVAALAVLISSGCLNGPSESPRADPGVDGDNAFRLLRTLNFEAIPRVFGPSRETRFTVTVVSEEYSASGDLVARSRETYDQEPSGTRTLRSQELEGAEFSSGLLSFLATGDSLRSNSEDALEKLIPEQPAFAEIKVREQFTYTAATDTSVSGEDSHLVIVRARVPPDQQPLRHARMAVAKSDSAILFLLLDRMDRSIFYEEASRTIVEMSRSSTGGLSPRRRHVDVSVDVPLEPRRRFTHSESYSPRQPEPATPS